MELKLAQIEWLSLLAYILGGEYAQQELHDSWECVLLHILNHCTLEKQETVICPVMTTFVLGFEIFSVFT